MSELPIPYVVGRVLDEIDRSTASAATRLASHASGCLGLLPRTLDRPALPDRGGPETPAAGPICVAAYPFAGRHRPSC